MDEGRKRVIGIMTAILASLHMQTADDLFGTPQGSPRTDKLIAASIQWAEQIMRRLMKCCGSSVLISGVGYYAVPNVLPLVDRPASVRQTVVNNAWAAKGFSR